MAGSALVVVSVAALIAGVASVVASAGWYADPSDDRIMRFWDGSQYTAERGLSGVAAGAGIVNTVPTSLQAKALAWPSLSPRGLSHGTREPRLKTVGPRTLKVLGRRGV